MLLLLLACAGPGSDNAADTAVIDAGPSSGTLRTLTYNVHGLPSVITGDDTPARMAAIAPLLPAYDLIGLQEDFDAENHAVVTGACTQPVVEWFDDKVEDKRLYGSGLAVLGPGAATLVHHQHFTACNGVLDSSSDCLASKGFQLIRLDVGQAEIDVYNTHMEAGGGADDSVARASNVQELLGAMAEFSADRPVLFMGDTNLSDGDIEDLPLILQLKDAGLRDACDEVGCAEPGRIDRIMLRNGGGISLVADSWSVEAAFFDADGVGLSDHDAIAVDVSWAVD